MGRDPGMGVQTFVLTACGTFGRVDRDRSSAVQNIAMPSL